MTMRHLLAISVLFLFAGSASADVLHLTDGKTLEGLVTDEGSRYTVVDRDAKYVVPKSRVESVESKKSFMDEYEERLAALPVDDPEAIFEFGRWLEDHEWPTRARRAYEEVLVLDPEHRGARRALGFKLFEGEWVGPDELNRRNGLVQWDDGRWYTPHDLAELKASIERDEKLRAAWQQQREINANVNGILRKFATFDPKQRKAAYEELSTYAERLDSPEIRKLADDSAAYYDRLVQHLCAQMKARTEIQATLTKLKKPIETFETSLGAAIAIVAGQTPVKIQLPELSIAQVKTTVDIPAGCG